MIHYSIAPDFDKMDLVLNAEVRPHRAYAVRYDDKTRLLTFFLGGTHILEIDDTFFRGLNSQVLELKGAGYEVSVDGDDWRVQTLVDCTRQYPTKIRKNF